MRKFLFSILFFVSVMLNLFQHLFAQTNIYHPFPEDTANWVIDSYDSHNCYNVTNFASNYCGSWIYLMKGDTIINSISYNKIYYLGGVKLYYIQSPPNPIIGCQGCSGNYSYAFAIRQDSINKKVYYIDSNMTSDTLLYNFNLTVGDTLPLTFGNQLAYPTTISSIDSIFISNSYHKRFNLNNNYHTLIEGVGWDCDLRLIFFMGYASYGLGCFDANHSFYSGECGITVTSNSEIENNFSFSISPNPSTGIFTLKISQTNSQLSIANIFGEKIMEAKIISEETKINLEHFNSGIYFLTLKNENGLVTKKLLKE